YWLPSLPQLGGKLMYEQYYGDEVALFGRDNRQKNPNAVTAGVNYTPVPLLTFGAEQRRGQSGKNDTRFSMDITYQLGVPWQQQINPGAVAAMRSLAGSRYDLAERNNNIVLEYRKKEVISLKTADLVTGYAGEQKSLGVSVNSKYGLERIDWSASPLIAAGGKIVQDGSDWAVVMPAYRSGLEASNSYTVSGVAVDRKGNRSEQSNIQIIVQEPVVSVEKSIFTPESSVLPADGQSKQTLTLSIVDLSGKKTDIPVSDIVLKSEGIVEAKVSELIRKDVGTFELTVYSGHATETVKLTPVVRKVNLRPATIKISDTMPDSDKSSLSANPASIVADNTSLSTLELTLKDSDGTVLSGLADKISFRAEYDSKNRDFSNNLTISEIREVANNKGHYTTTVKGKISGNYIFYPEFSGSSIGGLKVSIELQPDATSSKITEHSILKNNQVSDGRSKNIIKYKIQDSNGNPVKDQLINLSADNEQIIYQPQIRSDNDGIIVAEFTSSVSGDFTIIASNDNGSIQDKITFTDAVKFTGIKVSGPQLTSMPIGEYPRTFPWSGFNGATFTLKTNSEPSSLEWTTSADWFSLDNGKVKFLSEPTKTSRDVEIKVKSRINGSEAVYKFKLYFWFKNSGDQQFTPAEASDYCANFIGNNYYLPSKDELTSQWRKMNGRIWDEWGTLSNYPGAGFKTQSSSGSNLYYITSTTTSNGGYIKVEMLAGTPYGTVGGNNIKEKNYVVCQKKLF
ncbi:inverse autotransporter beta domain-containing protein, partial [Morganella morganii]|nr:inverse autotransporter beta domain-containing protein [Morganella morganii]